MALTDGVLTALRTRLLTVGTLPTLRFWENIIASPSATNKDAFTQDAVQLGTKTPISLATNSTGKRWWRWNGGLYRVTLHYPANTHLHAPLAVADAVAVAFHGSSLASATGEKITIETVRVAPAVGDATGTSVPVEIRFRFDQFDA
jgi:hypothetical protein